MTPPKPNNKTSYAVFDSYSKLAIPVALLEKIINSSYYVDIGYDSQHNTDTVSKVSGIDGVKLISGEDIAVAIAEARLSGEAT